MMKMPATMDRCVESVATTACGLLFCRDVSDCMPPRHATCNHSLVRLLWEVESGPFDALQA